MHNSSSADLDLQFTSKHQPVPIIPTYISLSPVNPWPPLQCSSAFPLRQLIPLLRLLLVRLVWKSRAHCCRGRRRRRGWSTCSRERRRDSTASESVAASTPPPCIDPRPPRVRERVSVVWTLRGANEKWTQVEEVIEKKTLECQRNEEDWWWTMETGGKKKSKWGREKYRDG